MNVVDFVLSVMHAFQGSVRGRTLLQKRCYFVAFLMGKATEYGFKPHYYGPFSPAIDNALTELQAIGFVEENSVGFGAADSSGFEIRRHDYRLTPDGQEIAKLLEAWDAYEPIRNAASRIVAAGDPGYFEMSIAAKAQYILQSQERAMTTDEIRNQAGRFGWQIDPAALEKAVSFLKSMDLIERGGTNQT